MSFALVIHTVVRRKRITLPGIADISMLMPVRTLPCLTNLNCRVYPLHWRPQRKRPSPIKRKTQKEPKVLREIKGKNPHLRSPLLAHLPISLHLPLRQVVHQLICQRLPPKQNLKKMQQLNPPLLPTTALPRRRLTGMQKLPESMLPMPPSRGNLTKKWPKPSNE